jgi:purine-nucleoside phosphorylase
VVRVGTCTALRERAELSELLLPDRAVAASGSSSSFGLQPGATIEPDTELLDRLRGHQERTEVVITSLDTMAASDEISTEAVAADMQTVAVLARGRELGIATAAILIVNEAGDERLDDEGLEAAAKLAGRMAAIGLSNPQLES